MRPRRIIVHHSKTKDSGTVSYNAIRRYHLNLGWSDVGYHRIIEDVNGATVVFCGRPLNIVGAHTRGENHDSIGICFVGDYDAAAPTEEMLDKGAAIIAGLCDTLDIDPSEIYTHNKFAAYKSCPGEKFSIRDLRERVRSKL